MVQKENTYPDHKHNRIILRYRINLSNLISAGLCWRLRRSLHRVWHRWRRRSGYLRRQDQEVHRSHKDQHELHCSCMHRLLSGESMKPEWFKAQHLCFFPYLNTQSLLLRSLQCNIMVMFKSFSRIMVSQGRQLHSSKSDSPRSYSYT